MAAQHVVKHVALVHASGGDGENRKTESQKPSKKSWNNEMANLCVFERRNLLILFFCRSLASNVQALHTHVTMSL